MTRSPLWLIFLHLSAVQALRGLPCLESFSAVRAVRHIEGSPGWCPSHRSEHEALKGAPWVGSWSSWVYQTLSGPASLLLGAPAGMRGERCFGDGSIPYLISSIALLPWLPGLPPGAFPTTASSLTSSWPVSPQPTAAFALIAPQPLSSSS